MYSGNDDDSAAISLFRFAIAVSLEKYKTKVPNMKKLIPASCFLLMALIGRNANAIDLLDIFQQAQLNDAGYAAAKAQYQAQQERLPQARAGLLPNINFDAGYDWNDLDVQYSSVQFNSGQRDFESYDYGISISQPLFRRQNRLGYDQAKIQVSQAETDLELANQDLVLRTATAYFDILRARANVINIRSLKSSVSQQLEQAKRNFAVGTATITDQREAQARYDLVIAQEIGFLNELQVSTYALEVLTGQSVQETELAGLQLPVVLSPPAPSDISAWVSQAYRSSLQALRAQQNLAIAETEIRLQRAGHAPTLDAIGTLAQAYQGDGVFGVETDTRTGVIGLQLSLPIYQGGAISSRTREAQALHERAAQELEDIRRGVALTTRQAYLGVSTGIAEVNALIQAVGSTELQVESSKLGYEVGVRTAVDVLNAETLLAAARRDLIQALYNTILSQLRLQAAIGRLVQADLQSVNELLAKEGS
jgi:outer membrane protein